MKYDNLLKTIFFDAMPALLRLLKCAPVVEFLSVEFPPRHKNVADVVALLADGKILHLEFQVKNDPDMHWRCYHYFGSISQRWPKAEVIQVVIYLGNGPMNMVTSIDRPTCKFHYEIINLQEVPAEVFLDSPKDAERMLAAVAKSEDPRATLRQIMTSWKGLSESELRELVERLRTLSQLRDQEIMFVEEIKSMPFELDVTESVVYKMGKERGEAAGVTATLRILSRVLERRFGSVPDPVRERIENANLHQLEDWIDRATDAGSLSEIFGN